MYKAPTFNLNHYVGTPVGTRRVGFSLPDGNDGSAFVRGIADDWDVSIFVDENTGAIFFVGTSPDKRELCVERWLELHAIVQKLYKTKVAQKADLDGKDAGTLTHEKIAIALRPKLTKNDKPQLRKKIELELHDAIEHKTYRKETKKNGKVVAVETVVEQKGNYYYHSPDYGTRAGEKIVEPAWYCEMFRTGSLMRTKGDPMWPRTVCFNKQKTEIFFLFTTPEGGYLLEALRETHTSYQRRETTAKMSAFRGQKPAAIVKTMADKLTHDPNSFG